MRPVRFLPFAVVVLTLLVAFAGPTQAHCHRSESEVLDVPLPLGAPPTLDGIEVLEAIGAAYRVVDPPVGHTYFLGNFLDVTMCTLGACVSLPDFNVAWYDADGQLIQDDQQFGPQDGPVPDGTADGVVYYRTAPYVLSTPQLPNWFHLSFYC